MQNYKFSEERERHPYKYYGKVFEVDVDDTTFVGRSSLRYVVDDYDKYLGSVEQSHYEDNGFFIIYNYNQPDDKNELDLTWIRNADVFRISKNEQNKSIRKVKANIGNLGYSTLPIGEDMFHDIELEINNNDSKADIISLVRQFKDFMEDHRDGLNGNIKLNGFTPITNKVLSHYAKRYGLKVIEDQTQKNK